MRGLQSAPERRDGVDCRIPSVSVRRTAQGRRLVAQLSSGNAPADAAGGLASQPSEPVKPRRIVDQDLLADRRVRRPHRQLVEQAAVVDLEQRRHVGRLLVPAASPNPDAANRCPRRCDRNSPRSAPGRAGPRRHNRAPASTPDRRRRSSHRPCPNFTSSSRSAKPGCSRPSAACAPPKWSNTTGTGEVATRSLIAEIIGKTGEELDMPAARLDAFDRGLKARAADARDR